MPTKKELKALDAQIEALYKKARKNTFISNLDMLKLFEAGRKANDEGRDLKSAIAECVKKIRREHGSQHRIPRRER